MKKKIRRLQLNRETLRNLTPESLDGVAGGLRTDDSCYNSCPLETIIPRSVCNSCFNFPTICC